jgi:hypothetical protein
MLFRDEVQIRSDCFTRRHYLCFDGVIRRAEVLHSRNPVSWQVKAKQCPSECVNVVLPK